ncbi:hypothetical protein Dshi_1542 [Dinoroseobacter shibae DFL 12 = DSM 16493]|jgi:hypothetical protein|uniref:Uncharacterized protein n=1 Tax=Dinoroseobacter shibae (strain DSM 16493 / NCIMB 14021 / DFL 12) TaxID=398580 RepID=A8LK85_DINSH|nr:hypothetical protein [Dinoroseobacter shibae]ABV93284.1 hypothetical protein Dshi_1542 [Dinoroseobacter shibae DFL 12 = DSM 16493]URF48204.1 hypothetical protein M8008_07955 [Dinoroseobacter shibae]URF52514.1 hypothetical protein M8007_07955 [Dinoroseobacter shibae]
MTRNFPTLTARILPLCLGLAAAPVAAQTGAGSITGTLELDDARWVVASAGEGPVSGFSQTGADTEIRIVGTPEPHSPAGQGTLVLEIEAEAGMTEIDPQQVTVSLDHDGDTLVADDENIDLTVTAFMAGPSDLAIAGSFTAYMTENPQDGLIVDADTGGMRIDGNFQATIPRQDS